MNLREKFLNFPLKILYIFGLWRKEHNNPYLYFIYSFTFLLFTQYLYAVTQVIYAVNVLRDIEKIAECAFVLLTQVTLCIKISVLILKKDTVIKLTSYMNTLVFAPSRAAHIEIINNTSTVQVIEFFMFIFMGSFTIGLCAIFPMIDAAPNERVLPFKAWYPLPDTQTPYYELLYFYQIFAIWIGALINGSVDRLSTAMTALGCAQMEILKDNIVNIEKYVRDDIEMMEELNKRESIHSEAVEILSFAKEMNLHRKRKSWMKEKYDVNYLINESFIKSIHHHKHIVRFVYEVEQCFHWGILAQLAASVGIICITGLQITLVNPSSIKFVSKITYLIAMLIQVFFICRTGNNISEVSSEVVSAVYISPWMDRRNDFKKLLIIFMERLKRPIVTKAGYFFPLSYQTFVSILRLSYSYFAVLKQVNSK